ncbi:MAG: hypothetical protein OXH81_06305, partial [Gemmatimonadetes bacterium]|nr:hypothetical protein [Gemmatimonadota bacterium]
AGPDFAGGTGDEKFLLHVSSLCLAASRDCGLYYLLGLRGASHLGVVESSSGVTPLILFDLILLYLTFCV